MRYTHNLRVIRKRKHANRLSLFITLLVVVLILSLGFTKLNAQEFFLGFFASFVRVSISYVIALVISILLILFIRISSSIETASIPILDALQSFPSFALYPLFVVWFGRTAIVTILILIAEMVWPILFSLLTAQKQIRPDLIEASEVYGARGYKYLVFVFFPLLLPAFVTGSIVAWGEAWEAIIAAEIIVRVPGVGTYLAQAGNNHQANILIIGVLMLLAILFILNKYIWLTLLNISTKYQQE